MYFSYDNLKFRYEPFPVGLAKPLMNEAAYEELVDNFPPLDLFEAHEALGKPHKKYTLSEKENERTYNAFIRSNALWRDFRAWVGSDAFVYGTLDALRAHDIDLGYTYISAPKRAAKRAKDILHGRLCARSPRLRAHFEFSALPADGGQVLPHTDARSKLVTMVVAIAREGEWNPAFGGGTDVNRPKHVRYSFNHVNRRAEFQDMEVVHTFEYTPNQAVIFVKTYDSWHSVRPMTGSGSSAMRRTLTINIVRDS